MGALARAASWRRSRRRISGQCSAEHRDAEEPGDEQPGDHRLGVSEKVIRKLIGPPQAADSAQLALAGVTQPSVSSRLPIASSASSRGRAGRVAQLLGQRRYSVDLIVTNAPYYTAVAYDGRYP